MAVAARWRWCGRFFERRFPRRSNRVHWSSLPNRLNAPRDDLFIQLGRRPLRLGVEVAAQRRAALLVLLQRQVAAASQRVKAHQAAVSLFIRRVGGGEMAEPLDARLITPARFVQLREALKQPLPEQAQLFAPRR